MKNKTGFEPMVWLPDDLASSSLKRYIDPQKPLSSEDIFLPNESYSFFYMLWDIFWIFISISLLSGSIVGLINNNLFVETSGQSVSKGTPDIIIFIFLMVFIPVGIKFWRNLKHKIKQKKQFIEGKYRIGLFILVDAILLHHNNHIFYLPKKQILEVRQVFRGRAEGSHLYVIYETLDKKTSSIDLDNYLDLGITNLELKMKLDKWLDDN